MWRFCDSQRPRKADTLTFIRRASEARAARCEQMNGGDNPPRRLGPGGWAAIVILFGFLVAAVAYAIHGWNSVGAVGIPTIGWLFLIAGVIVTLGVGGGLMALMFYSSRKGRDF
ncbi:MAG TPA: hypothetical protein VGG69_07400 [Rhizomicrobium sp.]|jgi:hypothetical protein